jgi:hypothetical protein
VRLPRGGKDFALQANDVDETVGGLYTFHRKVTLNGDTVTMENETRALKAELPAADAPKVRDRMAELGNHGQFIRLPAMYEATDGDLAALADDKPALARAWLVRGAAAFDRGDMPGAITGLKATLAIDPKQAPAHALLAFAYASQGDALPVPKRTRRWPWTTSRTWPGPPRAGGAESQEDARGPGRL